MTDLVDRLDANDPRALPRLLTLVENGDPAGIAALRRLAPRAGRAHVVGITGPPGAGKSTLVNALVGVYRARGERVAVVAVDPSSPLTGGAVLGDRVRMGDRHRDEGVFIRSMASRGAQGGLALATRRVVRLLDAAGYPTILVETVGTGQDGVDVAGLVDTVVVVQVPGLGDGVQAIKAGVLEVGDVIAVNKGDLPGAEEVQRQLRDLSRDRHDPDGWARPVLRTVAATGEGVEALADAIRLHRAWLDAHPSQRVPAGAAQELAAAVAAHLRREARKSTDGWLTALLADVESGVRSADEAAAEFVDRATRGT